MEGKSVRLTSDERITRLTAARDVLWEMLATPVSFENVPTYGPRIFDANDRLYHAVNDELKWEAKRQGLV
jgi:hypothetical protein